MPQRFERLLGEALDEFSRIFDDLDNAIPNPSDLSFVSEREANSDSANASRKVAEDFGDSSLYGTESIELSQGNEVI
ncbi:MAG TPA: hypothetical protein VHG72_14080 [Polyangia bacterium]|nr:hypothetical protein [Polyangia bacterium]